ncbi:hypothetical protein [Capnocytophaga canis]|uniref:hypothetical protein n=1 Tax=Capnocytophaga canis TaxID=1848903 RepID=UPI001561C1EA|nr:hypothetical protein [Capnocytophaga canis]
MAYNRINLLKKIIEVQELTLHQYHKVGLTYKEIYWQHIYPKYHICYRTFHTYLGTPAKKQLKELQQAKAQQLELFK